MMPRDDRLSNPALRHESPCVPLYLQKQNATRQRSRERGRERALERGYRKKTKAKEMGVA
jgi:hypothetical protein